MEAVENSSVITVNVFKKSVGKVLISTLFKLELNLEKRLISKQQKAFSLWKLKVMNAKAVDAASADKAEKLIQDAQKAKERQSVALRSIPRSKSVSAKRSASTIQEHLTDALDVDRHTTIDSVSSTLRSIYIYLTAETEKFHTKLSDLHDQSQTEMVFRDASREAKILVLVVFLRQAMKRKLKWGFDRWYFVQIRKARSEARVKQLLTSLNLESQKTATRQFHIEAKLAQNDTVSNAIECSHAFSHWKMKVVKDILNEERRRGEVERKSLLTAFRSLKSQLHVKNHKNKAAISKSLAQGKKLSKSLSQLHASLLEARGLVETTSEVIGAGVEKEVEAVVKTGVGMVK